MEEVKELAGRQSNYYNFFIEEQGIDELRRSNCELFFEGTIDSGDMTYVSNARHIALLNQAEATIEDAIEADRKWCAD